MEKCYTPDECGDLMQRADGRRLAEWMDV